MWDVLFKLLWKDIVGGFFAEQEDSHQQNKIKGILLGLLRDFLGLYQDLMFPQECLSYT